MKASLHTLTLIISICLFFGCERQTNLVVGEGYLTVPGGKVWYKITGTGKKTPLLLLHGGPGFPSYYLKSMAELGKDRPVIFMINWVQVIPTASRILP